MVRDARIPEGHSWCAIPMFLCILLQIYPTGSFQDLPSAQRVQVVIKVPHDVTRSSTREPDLGDQLVKQDVGVPDGVRPGGAASPTVHGSTHHAERATKELQRLDSSQEVLVSKRQNM